MYEAEWRGEDQRVFVACTLADNPRVTVSETPGEGLSVDIRRRLVLRTQTASRLRSMKRPKVPGWVNVCGALAELRDAGMRMEGREHTIIRLQ